MNKRNALVKVGLLSLAMNAAPGFADTSTSVSIPAAEQKKIEQVVHHYLVAHPEVLVEASQVLQKRQQNEAESQAQSAIVNYADKIFVGKLTVDGNPNGAVTLVEFFDYQCIHCKKMRPVVAELVKKNANLRVLYKEFPIFGKQSDMASAAALAAAMQGKYKAFQAALLAVDKPLTEKIILDTAQSVGLAMDKLKQDMASKSVKDELAANRTLAESIHLMGTPAFIIAATPAGKFDTKTKPRFIPGGASEASLQELINQVTPK